MRASTGSSCSRHRQQCGPCTTWTTTRRAITVKVAASQPCLIVSNDDGVESPALLSLAAKLRRETGHRVVVVAPSHNKSAASMGLTLRTDMELRVRQDLGPDTFALTGTPTDCVMVALDATKGLMRALDLHPIMALSGPNYGPNMGTDVLLSGTVGAARTAGLYGVPALAASSTSLDKSSSLENAVDVTLEVAALALQTLGGQPARNWPRNHIVVGGGGRRHVSATCEYESLPQSWVLDVEQVLLDAFRDGDVFINLNVPSDWKRGRDGIRTTGLGLMFYRDSYVVSVPRQTLAATEVAEREPVMVGVATTAAAASSNGNGNGNGKAAMTPVAASAASSTEAVVKGISEALALGQPVVYNNAYDTRRTVPVDRSDVMALQAGDISISTLQTWPEGHTLCLSDQVMARALLSGLDGIPAWLQGGGRT